MIAINRTGGLCMTFAVLFVLVGSALAEGEWATNGGGDTYNTNSGNVGIGTMSPESKLHVNGNVLFNNPADSMGGNKIKYNYGERTYKYVMEGNGYNLILKGKNWHPILSSDRINGSLTGPTSVANNDRLFEFRVSGTNPNGTQTSKTLIDVSVDGVKRWCQIFISD